MKVKVNVLIDKLGWLEVVPKEYALDSDLAVQLGGRLLEIDTVKRVEFTNINFLEKTEVTSGIVGDKRNV